MNVLECEQGTTEWREARLGIPTASAFKRILTPTGKGSSSAEGYLAELLAEWALGEPISEFVGNEWTERGHMLEPEARTYYSFHRDLDVDTVGFIYRDDAHMSGCSPDGMVGEDGLLELKCPSAGKHLLWLSRGRVPPEHKMQAQGALWVSGRAWLDWMSFYPNFPPLLIRVMPDPKIQSALDVAIPEFITQVIAGRERLVNLGVQPNEEDA